MYYLHSRQYNLASAENHNGAEQRDFLLVNEFKLDMVDYNKFLMDIAYLIYINSRSLRWSHFACVLGLSKHSNE